MISYTPTPGSERLRLVPRDGRASVPEFVGASAVVADLLARADRLARTELPLLITGESGAGKEVLFRRIHARSARADGPYVAENCAAIPENLLESEFFGHVRGAFTGANRGSDGAFVRADGGTLFLDEIGDMPFLLQAKLLRVLEDGQVRPVGGSTSRTVDVRLVCATNKDLQQLVQEGKFREDLYYRLLGASLRIPPLRERREDAVVLAEHFLGVLNEEHGTRKHLSEGLRARFSSYSWPGNVRELRNRITRLFFLAESNELEDEGFGESHAVEQARATSLVTAVAPMAEIEKDAIRLALLETNGDRRVAARRLGISRTTIYAKIKKYGLDDDRGGVVLPLSAER